MHAQLCRAGMMTRSARRGRAGSSPLLGGGAGGGSTGSGCEEAGVGDNGRGMVACSDDECGASAAATKGEGRLTARSGARTARPRPSWEGRRGGSQDGEATRAEGRGGGEGSGGAEGR